MVRQTLGRLWPNTGQSRKCLDEPSDWLDERCQAVSSAGQTRDAHAPSDPSHPLARRFRAVFVCGLQDAEFPRRPTPEPFLDDDARADLARATGLVLPHHEDVLARERYLLAASAGLERRDDSSVIETYQH